MKVVAKRRANDPDPLRDGSEKSEGYPRGARETMVARYKRWRLGVSGWNPERKALGFFGHVAWQASGWREGEAGKRVERRRSRRAGGVRAKLL